MNYTQLTDPEDMQWLREVHLKDLPEKYKSAVLYGNEDSPDRVEVYEKQYPEHTDKPVVYRLDRETDTLVKEASVPDEIMHLTYYRDSKKFSLSSEDGKWLSSQFPEQTMLDILRDVMVAVMKGPRDMMEDAKRNLRVKVRVQPDRVAANPNLSDGVLRIRGMKKESTMNLLDKIMSSGNVRETLRTRLEADNTPMDIAIARDCIVRAGVAKYGGVDEDVIDALVEKQRKNCGTTKELIEKVLSEIDNTNLPNWKRRVVRLPDEDEVAGGD